jgi:hypothetical protein
MSSTLGQSSLNFRTIDQENQKQLKDKNEHILLTSELIDKQLLIKNIDSLPRIELEAFLKVNLY